MWSKLIGTLSFAVLTNAHVGAWHKAMYCINVGVCCNLLLHSILSIKFLSQGPQKENNDDANNMANPLHNLTKADWWCAFSISLSVAVDAYPKPTVHHEDKVCNFC